MLQLMAQGSGPHCAQPGTRYFVRGTWPDPGLFHGMGLKGERHTHTHTLKTTTKPQQTKRKAPGFFVFFHSNQLLISQASNSSQPYLGTDRHISLTMMKLNRSLARAEGSEL